MADINVSRKLLPSLLGGSGGVGSEDDQDFLSSFCHVHLASSTMDESSTYDTTFGGVGSSSSCCLGGDGGGTTTTTLSPIVISILRLSKSLASRLVNVYLSSTIMLVVVPLLVGMILGWCLCRTTMAKTNDHPSPGDEPKRTQYASSSTGRFFLGRILATIVAGSWTTKVDRFVRPQPSQHLHLRNAKTDDDTTTSATTKEDETARDDHARAQLLSPSDTTRESGVDAAHIPQHVAVIMDGNRRWGRARYGVSTRGHWEGSKKLVEFAKWCLAEKISILTVYAFSTENWDREPAEIAALMTIFCQYVDELIQEAVTRGIRIRVLSTETERLPDNVKHGIQRMINETAHHHNNNNDSPSLLMNICLSYGGRGEILNACRSIVTDVMRGALNLDDDGGLREEHLERRLLCPDNPDVILRTSGERRLSNFLLWQSAYAELFFLDVPWPDVTKSHLLDVIRSYAEKRRRRFGK